MTKYLMCTHGGHVCTCIQNMKFLCLTLCQGEVCTDADANAEDANTDNANANDANANNDGQSMTVQGSLVDKPNEPKTSVLRQ